MLKIALKLMGDRVKIFFCMMIMINVDKVNNNHIDKHSSLFIYKT